VCGVHADQLGERLECADRVARHVAVGALVSPTDRHNVGVVVALDDSAGRVTVEFVSAAGRHATRSFNWADLRLLDGAEPRPLPAAAQQRLDSITGELTEQIGHWQATVGRLGVEPGDARRYHWAIDRHLERHTHTLTAQRPAWLTELLGPRPDDVAGSTAWDDAVGDIARWRTGHQLPDATTGLGHRPRDVNDAAAWDALQSRLARTRVWLADSDRIHPAETIVPSYDELLERRAELDTLFAAAPADWRPTIGRLQAGQLILDDTAALVQAALDGQQARRDWILTNWPYVVEHQEINRTLTTGTWGPDPRLLTELLTRPLTDTLATAIDAGEPWLRIALCVVADGKTTSLDDETIEWFDELAAARAERGVPAALATATWPDATVDIMWDVEGRHASIVDSVDL
jgi:hypothetical protein